MDKVEEFIQRRFKEDYNWTCGRCYFFAIILKDIFPGGKIFYDPIDGHFIYRLNDKFYDWTGCRKYTKKEIEHFYDWEILSNWDILLYKRIEKDCIK